VGRWGGGKRLSRIGLRVKGTADTLQVVNYRDHRPQDNTYVYQFHPFTADISEVQTYLKGLTGGSLWAIQKSVYLSLS
jgi:hypothetical protein